MLDWSKIDTWQKFQRLCNALFELEMNSTDFKPSDPNIGDDGGKDGFIKKGGNYLGKTGTFLIQSKYHKEGTQPKDAFEQTKAELKKKEFNNYKKNKADWLFLCINTPLNTKIDYRDELEKFAKENDVNMVVCDKEWLAMKIERQPFLRYYYFSNPSIPLFLPPSIYFTEVKERLVDINVSGGIKSVEDRFDELKSFINNDTKKIFILHAFGGFGKSYFLKQFPQKVISPELDREIWFIRYGRRKMCDAIQDEIGVRDSNDQKHKYIFVLDDADRADDVKDILNSIVKSDIDAKLIITLRTAGLSSIEEMIDTLRCRDLTIYTRIPEWSKDELKALLRTAAQKDKVDDENEIVQKYPNPFFIIEIGLNIRGRSDYDFQKIKQAILESLLNDTRKILSTEEGDIKDILFHLSLITPINLSDSRTIAKLAQKLNLDEKDMRKVLEKLSEGGVLRAIGSVLRFIPDMIGDIYLLETMQNLSENARKEAFLYWLDSHSRNIFCNLGATLRYGEQDCLVSVVTNIVSGWINNADKYDNYEKRRVLENLEEICYLIPDKALDMLWAFIDTPGLTTDDFGPVVIRLIRSNCERKKIIDIIEGLRCRVKSGTYGNYQPDTLVREAVTPLRNSIENKIMPILQIIGASLKGVNPIIEFSKVALQEVLASAHEWTHSTYESMQFGSRALKATEQVLAMRNKAIELVKEMLLSYESKIRLAGIDVAEDIGRCHSGPGVSSDIPLKKKIIEERNELLDFIDQQDLISKETDRYVLSSYEDLLFGWWSHQDVSDDKTLALLNRFKYDPEYRIVRFYASRWDIAGDVRNRLKDAPSKDRWPWVVDNIMQRKWHLTVDDFDKDAEALSKKYVSPEDIATFLNWIGKTVTISSANALFLRAWFKKNSEAFKEIREKEELWSKIPLLFKYTITYDLVQRYPEMAKSIIDEALLSENISTDEAKIAIDILSYDIPGLDKTEIIKEVAEKNIDELNLSILERIRFIRDKISAASMAEIILIVLHHLSPQAKSKATDHVSFILHSKGKEYVSEFLKITENELHQTLLSIGKLDYHDFEIIAHLFSGIDELLNFIETRLKNEKRINKYSEYEAVPFHGIEFINKFITTTDSYRLAIKKAIEWNKKYEGLATYSVSKVFEQFVSLRDASGDLYFNKVKNEFYNKDNFPDCLQCLFRLSLNKSNLETFKEVIGKSTELGYENEMATLLIRGKLYPEGGWSSSVGQTPPAFLEKKESFKELRDSTPAGKLRNALDQCINGVEKMIEDHAKDEENRRHSR